MLPDPLLPEQNRPAIGALDQHAQAEQKRTQEDQANCGKKQIEPALEPRVWPLECRQIARMDALEDAQAGLLLVIRAIK